jgi:hypothetical protein
MATPSWKNSYPGWQGQVCWDCWKARLAPLHLHVVAPLSDVAEAPQMMQAAWPGWSLKDPACKGMITLRKEFIYSLAREERL